jgi:hypothetical protein
LKCPRRSYLHSCAIGYMKEEPPADGRSPLPGGAPEGRLEQLRAQRAQAGSTVAARGIEREMEKQEALLSELSDFRDKLERVVKLDFTPDLDDGMVLTVAPLWELVPWKVAKDYWQELVAGKYPWSSVGQQLRDRGLVK